MSVGEIGLYHMVIQRCRSDQPETPTPKQGKHKSNMMINNFNFDKKL